MSTEKSWFNKSAYWQPRFRCCNFICQEIFLCWNKNFS